MASHFMKYFCWKQKKNEQNDRDVDLIRRLRKDF